MAKSVPQSIAVRLYRPSAGCQEASVKKASTPADPSTRKSTINTTMAPARAAQPRRIQSSSRSLGKGNKALLPDDVVDLGGTSKLDELLDQAIRWVLGHQIERPGEREFAVGDVVAG